MILLLSLLAAIANQGMHTFITPLITDPANGTVSSVIPYLWVWGIGGVLGSFLIGPLVDRNLAIMIILSVPLLVLLSDVISSWLVSYQSLGSARLGTQNATEQPCYCTE